MAVKPVRLTGTSYAVLALLELNPEATPYDLKRLLQMSVENFWLVPHTTAYAEPERLANAGLLSVRQEPAGRRRKRYALTAAGRDALDRWRQRSEVTVPELREEGLLKIFAGADPWPIMLARRDYHRAKLAELELYLTELPRKPRLHGARASLLLGTSYHRKLLEAIDDFLTEQAGSPPKTGAGGGRRADRDDLPRAAGVANAAQAQPDRLLRERQSAARERDEQIVERGRDSPRRC